MTLKASAELAAILARKPTPDLEIVAGYLSGEITTRPAGTRQKSARRFQGRFVKPRYQRSPDRQRSIKRRRTLAATWPMPPRMCGELTTSQAAFARIAADEAAQHGDCRLTLDEIAARGGMSRKTAKRAQDRLAELNWITVEVREVSGRKNLSNVLRIMSPEWRNWIAMGPRPRRIGGHFGDQKCPTTVNPYPLSMIERSEAPQGAIREVQVTGPSP